MPSKYKAWKSYKMGSQPEWKPYGNLKVICNGTFLVHPVRPWWWSLEAYIFVGLGIFIYERDLFDVYIFSIGISLGILSLIASFKTTFSDPGVVPKPLPEIGSQNQAEAENIVKITKIRYVKKIVEIPGTDKTETHFYCAWCQHFRPPGCQHCDVCDCCIKGYDHHCPVYGGCIGKNNKVWFHIMVTAIPAFFSYLLVNSAFFVIRNGTENYQHPLTLYYVLLGFFGAIILPPIFTLCPSLDRIHHNATVKRRFRPARNVPSKTTTSPHNLYPTYQVLHQVPGEDDKNGNDEDIKDVDQNENDNYAGEQSTVEDECVDNSLIHIV